MSAFTSSSLNPLASHFLGNKIRRNNSSILIKSNYDAPNAKRMKRENCYNFFDIQGISMNTDSNSVKYDFLDDNVPEDGTEVPQYFNINDIPIDDDYMPTERYSLDDIDTEIDPSTIIYETNKDQGNLVSGILYDNAFQRKPPKSKNKRKQGIVGRPTLRSPQQLQWADNVYSTGKNTNNMDNLDYTDYQETNQQLPLQPVKTNINSTFKAPNKIRNYKSKEFLDHEEPINQRSIGNIYTTNNNYSRSRPRILTKPKINDLRNRINNTGQIQELRGDRLQLNEEEANKQSLRNAEFARKIINRAQQQGSKVDPNKIPDFILKDSLSENNNLDRTIDKNIQYPLVAELKKTESVVTQSPNRIQVAGGNANHNLDHTSLRRLNSIITPMTRLVGSSNNGSSLLTTSSNYNNSSTANTLISTAAMSSSISSNSFGSTPINSSVNSTSSPKPTQLTASTLLMRRRKNQRLDSV